MGDIFVGGNGKKEVRGDLAFSVVGELWEVSVVLVDPTFRVVGGFTVWCRVRVFRQKFTLKNAIGSHACSLEALACV